MRDFIFVKDGDRYVRVLFSELLYVEASDKYVRVVTSQKEHLVLGTIGSMEAQLPPDLFCRVHRSYIVAFRHVITFTLDKVVIGGRELPISKQYRPVFFRKALMMPSRGQHYPLPLSLIEIRELAQNALRWQS